MNNKSLIKITEISKHSQVILIFSWLGLVSVVLVSHVVYMGMYGRSLFDEWMEGYCLKGIWKILYPRQINRSCI